MELIEVQPFGAPYLAERIRQTPLRGYDQARLYADAEIAIRRHVSTEDLAPAQNYVLRDGVERALALRDALRRHDLDLFDLDGGAWVRTDNDPGRRIPVLPPVVEESREPDGTVVTLVSDGLHRVFAARSVGSAISVLSVRAVPPEYPYYAYPVEGGWRAVLELDELREGQQKKNYRQPDSYKALFRDYNAVFPGVQEQRKKTNPAHLTA